MVVVFLTLNIINYANVPALFQDVRRLVMQILIAKDTLLSSTESLRGCAKLLLLLVARMIVIVVEVLAS